jgi:hypothetical protein
MKMEYKTISLTHVSDYKEIQTHTDKDGHKPLPQWEDLYAYHISQHHLDITLVTEISDEKLVRNAMHLWSDLTIQGIGITIAQVMRSLHPNKIHLDSVNTNIMIVI